LKFDHQRHRWLAGFQYRVAISNIVRLFGPVDGRLFGLCVRCSLRLIRDCFEYREQPAPSLKSFYFPAINTHPQGIGTDSQPGRRHR
jgi:hypothetical protein